MKVARSWYNGIFGAIAAIAALVCLGMGLDLFNHEWAKGIRLDGLTQAWAKANANVIVGLWVVLPPVFFWVDWVAFCRGLTKDELDVAKHTHELSRNIWLALVVVLGALLGIKLGP